MSSRWGERHLSDTYDICAYCGDPALTGQEKPEHPIPAALGSSFTVRTVCDPCNEWANKHVDQPFLKDDWARLHRAEHDVRDPRRPQRRTVPHPLKRGFTEEGVRLTADEAWRPQLGSRIIEDEDGERVRIVAGSTEEAERLRKVVEERAAAEGKTAEIGEFQREQVQPRINATVKVDLRIWLRMAAKISLGMASVAFPEKWRSSGDAKHLRLLMRGERRTSPEGEPLGLFPTKLETDNPIRALVDPPEHLAFFLRGSGETTRAVVVLFGELAFGLPVDTSGSPPPGIAWRLDPNRPRAGGETTFDGLLVRVVERLDPAKGGNDTDHV